MTTSVTDDRAMFEEWADQERVYDLRRGKALPDEYLFSSTDRAWRAWQAALRSQGKVVEVSKLRDLAHWWGKNIERMQGRVNPHEIAGLTRCQKELTAIIGEGD